MHNIIKKAYFSKAPFAQYSKEMKIIDTIFLKSRYCGGRRCNSSGPLELCKCV